MEARLLDLSRDGAPKVRFDLIIGGMVLHHVADHKALLKTFHGLLKDDGILAIADLDAEDGQFHGGATGISHHGFEQTELKQTLSEIGYEVLNSSIIHTMKRQHADGTEGEYPIFLMTARRK